MQITKVFMEDYHKYIPLKGWDSVVNALNIFAGGGTKGSHATEDHQMDAVSRSSGAMGFAFYVVSAPHMKGASSEFVEQMLTNAKMSLRGRDGWRRSYDYDGRGVFFKTGVEILVLDREAEIYALGINAAYVGDEPEVGLADRLGIPRALIWAKVGVEVEPLGEDQFAFDFEQILRQLDDALSTHEVEGATVAKAMLVDDLWDKAHFLLYQDEHVRVHIGPGRVESRFVYDKPGEARDTWVVDGAVLTGLLAESYEDRTQKDPPTVSIVITSARSTKRENKPIHEPEGKEHVSTLMQSIMEALQ